MSVSLKPVSEQTLVITGATSGIGLATALEAADRGANLLLIARSPDRLEDAAQRCRDRGAKVETLAADVADQAVLEMAHEKAHEAFGGFDTWVNNAGASVYGLLVDVPLDDARQVFETNYWGTVHGSLVAARHFKEAGTSGAIVNVGSVLSDRAFPLQGHYSATKHAIKGFTDALRMELDKEDVPVSVTLIKPNATDTPYPEHAANYMDQEPVIPSPAYAPETVARAILSAAEKPARDVTVGAKDGVMAALGMVAPGLVDKISVPAFFEQQKSGTPATGNPKGNLYEPPSNTGTTRGNLDGRVFEHSIWSQMQQKPLLSLGAAALVGAAIAMAGRD
ncbi:SDR family oxidoreductase [Rubrivirga sp.]|uniref:SDR family oxidoreductase n=1 Tax=Rubrivirga sp. TaxID=1885344 RepID=UPI003C7918B2